MAIFRGVGGSGDSSDNSFLQEVTGQANAASASASASSASASASSASAIAASTSASNASNSADDAETAKLIAQSSVSTALAQAIIATTQAGIATTKASEAAASATSAQNLEITSASFDTADGTLTLTKANSGTVTTDLDGRYADLSGATFTGDLRIESTLPRLYLTDTNNNSDYSIINTDGKFSIYDDSAGVYRTVIDSSGNVGIGTTSPATKLAVHGGTSGTDVDVASFNSVSGALNIRCSDLAAANPTWTLRSFSGEPIAFAQATDERMRIDSSGNVGIGTDTPAQALDVVGNIAVSGTVDGVDIDSLNTTVAGKANLSGATFTGNVNIGIPPSGTQSLTVAGTTNLYGGVTGDLDVTGTVTAPNVDISTTGSVTTNIATGSDNNNNTDVKVVNIGTGYGGSSGSGDSTTINMGSQDIFAKNIFNMGNGVTTANGSTINLKGTVNVDGNLDVDGKIIGSTEGVVLEHNKSADLEPVLELQNTTAQGNGYRGAFISMTGYNTSGTEYTRGVIGMGNSTAQYSFPYIAANITSVSCGIKLSGSTGTTYNALTPCNSIGTSLNNGMQCGHPFYKWNTVYATNGNIATSDQTHKRDVEELSEAETRVAIACKGLLRKYRWKDAYEEKGEEARIHFGIMAQDLRDAFSAEGLDASRYAMFCSDTWWEDETGERHEEQELAPEGAVETTQLGVRYDELLAFIIAAI
jgi:cytoskeletal protein CcmA (bactofilin family)